MMHRYAYQRPLKPRGSPRSVSRDPKDRAEKALQHAEALNKRIPELRGEATQKRITPFWPFARRVLNQIADAYDVADDALEEANVESWRRNSTRARAKDLRNARFLVSKTYETWTQEDLEAGDTNNKGFTYEDTPFSPRNLVMEINRFYGFEPSEWPLQLPRSQLTLYSTTPEPNYTTGEDTNYALHIVGSESAVTRLVRYLDAQGLLPRGSLRDPRISRRTFGTYNQ